MGPWVMITAGWYNFLVPVPRFSSCDDLNDWLEDQCLKRHDDIVRGHSEPIGERLMRDLDALMEQPSTPYDACEKVSTRATSISMVRYRNTDYSVPMAYAHHEVQVRGYVDTVVIGCGAQVIARHRRSYEKGRSCNFTSGNSFGADALSPCRGMPRQGRSIPVFHGVVKPTVETDEWTGGRIRRSRPSWNI